MPSFMKVPAHKIGVVPDVSPTGLPQTKFSDFKEDMDRDGSDSITVDEVKMRLEYIQELDAAVSVKFFSDVHKVDSHFTPIEILKFQRNVDDFTKVRCPWRASRAARQGTSIYGSLNALLRAGTIQSARRRQGRLPELVRILFGSALHRSNVPGPAW